MYSVRREEVGRDRRRQREDMKAGAVFAGREMSKNREDEELGDGCAALVYVIPVICELNIYKMLNFMPSLFYHDNKKIIKKVAGLVVKELNCETS